MIFDCGSFFQKAPSLLYGVALYLGFSLGFGQMWSLLGVVLIMMIAEKRRTLTALVIISAIGYVKTAYVLPQETTMEGTAHISIASIKPYRTPFTQGLAYSGTIKWFHQNGKITGKNIPIDFKPSTSISADKEYFAKGTLKKSRNGAYRFLPKKGRAWKSVEGSWSLTERRHRAKTGLKKLISEKISSPKAAVFLGGIATGIFDDPFMIGEFSRFGLQHIMAISGFHFALVAFFISKILKVFMRERRAACLVVFALTSYFILLGTSPSIFRAWVMSIIYFMGIVLHKESRPLNSLGLALIVILILNPPDCLHPGFQFSFLVTASILFFYQPMDNLLQKIFAKRRYSELIEMRPLDRHGYVVSSLLRQSLALMMAVQFVGFPLILFSAHKFPLLSLLYNLFFPFLVSLSVFLLILGMTPGLGFIHSLNSAYTDAMLNLAYGLPSSFDFWIRIDYFPPFLLAGYLSLLFLIAIDIRQRLDEKKIIKGGWSYI